jgi:hypothetical protein
LESGVIAERRAGNAFVFEIRRHQPAARVGVLMTPPLLVNYGGFCLPVRAVPGVRVD